MKGAGNSALVGDEVEETENPNAQTTTTRAKPTRKRRALQDVSNSSPRRLRSRSGEIPNQCCPKEPSSRGSAPGSSSAENLNAEPRSQPEHSVPSVALNLVPEDIIFEESVELPPEPSTALNLEPEESASDSEVTAQILQEPSIALNNVTEETVSISTVTVQLQLVEVDPFDIDTRDMDNQFAVAQYAPEIYSYLRQAERQPDINERMRSILNDWLVEVHLKFRLRPATFFLCIQIIDRFLQDNQVNRGRLQLVGVTAMMLACKYEEIYPPEIRDFVYICDNAYTREQILEMEAAILRSLDFRLSLPTAWSFMKRFCKAAGREGDEAFAHLVSCLVEHAMIDYRMITYAPSLLVSSAVVISNKLLGATEIWSQTMQRHCFYSQTEMETCVRDLQNLFINAPSETRYRAVHRKYSHPRFFGVALLDTTVLTHAQDQ